MKIEASGSISYRRRRDSVGEALRIEVELFAERELLAQCKRNGNENAWSEIASANLKTAEAHRRKRTDVYTGAGCVERAVRAGHDLRLQVILNKARPNRSDGRQRECCIARCYRRAAAHNGRACRSRRVEVCSKHTAWHPEYRFAGAARNSGLRYRRKAILCQRDLARRATGVRYHGPTV